MHQCHRAAFAGGEFRASQARLQPRAGFQECVEVGALHTVADYDDTNLLRPNGRDICLAAAGPVNFNVLAPGSEAIVAAFAISLPLSDGVLESGPPADAGGVAVRAHNPARGNELFAYVYALRRDGGHRRSPHQLHAALF